MPDKYTNFSELKKHEREHEDYTIFYREGNSGIAVMAVHGGGIEPGTIDIADTLAGAEHTFYGFKGLKKSGNKILHISSTRFDEPAGVGVSRNARIVVSIHGSRYRRETVHIGGRHQRLKQAILYALANAGFHAEISDVPGIRGVSPENICNRCRGGQGVQLELSRGLREKMFDHLDHRTLRQRTAVFYRFVDTVKKILTVQ